MFFRPTRKPRESEDIFNERVGTNRVKQIEFYEGDCITTFLNVWLSSQIYPEKATYFSMKKWCAENGIYDIALSDINTSVKNIIKTLKNLGYNVNVPDTKSFSGLHQNVCSLVAPFFPYLELGFSENIFVPSFFSNRRNATYQKPGINFDGSNYKIDNKAANSNVLNGGEFKRCIACNLRQIGQLTVLSNIIELPLIEVPTSDDTFTESTSEKSSDVAKLGDQIVYYIGGMQMLVSPSGSSVDSSSGSYSSNFSTATSNDSTTSSISSGEWWK